MTPTINRCNVILTPALSAAASLYHILNELRDIDADLIAASARHGQHSRAVRAAHRAYVLRCEVQRWIALEVREQRRSRRAADPQN
jgi:hypothetical protein